MANDGSCEAEVTEITNQGKKVIKQSNEVVRSDQISEKTRSECRRTWNIKHMRQTGTGGDDVAS